MTRVLAALLLGLLGFVGSAAAIDQEAAFQDAARQARYEHLTSELRCLVCQNQTIADSNADLAADLRRQVKELIAAGQTDTDIKRFMTERYGDFVLYEPPLTARTVLLWAAPGLLVLLAVGAAIRVIRRRAQLPFEEDVA
jgi:cytochrome c-type biogenesis protein CcmH